MPSQARNGLKDTELTGLQAVTPLGCLIIE